MARKRNLRIGEYAGLPIGWERAALIFDNPLPPNTVWEQQFDGFDTELARLTQTPYEEIDFADLWYYHHDLAYVDLQPEVFAYLFPACLMDWHETLLNNRSCSHGDSEFHYGMRQGDVFQKMLTPRQQEAVVMFFRDSFLERLDRELQFAVLVDGAPTFVWFRRFNSLGFIIPRMDAIWDAWWKLESPGRAVAALQYCSSLMYFPGKNPLFQEWEGYPADVPTGLGLEILPNIWANDATIFDSGWLPENLEFLSETLNAEFVSEKVAQAVARLSGEPQRELARRVEQDLPKCQDLIRERTKELPQLLADPNPEGWSV